MKLVSHETALIWLYSGPQIDRNGVQYMLKGILPFLSIYLGVYNRLIDNINRNRHKHATNAVVFSSLIEPILGRGDDIGCIQLKHTWVYPIARA